MPQQAELERERRRAFASPGGTFDRFVDTLRVILPIGVGAMLAILVVTPVTDRAEFSFLLNRQEVPETRERLKTVNALYRGEDGQGRPFSLRAERAVQRSSKEPLVYLDGMIASFVMDGQPASLSARSGVFDIDKEEVRIIGDMQFSSESGLDLKAANVIISLKDRSLRSGSGVASGNGRSVEAGRVAGDYDRQRVSLSSGVSGDSEFGAFRAEALVGDFQERMIRLAGGVSGSNDDFGVYRADDLSVDLENERYVMSGNVSGRSRFGQYRADRLIVSDGGDSIVLEGNARLRIDPGKL